MTTIRERVEKGMALLDKRKPTWWREDRIGERIDLDALDLADDCMCPLGQSYGGYDNGLERLRLDTNEAINHGFEHDIYACRDDQCAKRYASLTREWKRRIRERRS